MIRKLFWVGVGAAVGVYLMRRLDSLKRGVTPSLAGRAVSLPHAARAFANDVRVGMRVREAELRARLEHEAPRPASELDHVKDGL